MTAIFDTPLYPYAHHPDQGGVARHPVVIVGAGPVGLALAIDLALQDVPVVVLDDNDKVSSGSRAICFAKRTLEILDRLGVAAPLTAKGVQWQRGRVFFGQDEVYTFDLLAEEGHKQPAFINLQQYYLEAALVARAHQVGVQIRGRNRVTGVDTAADHVALTVDTPDGPYQLQADWLVACDGAKSPLRDMLGLGFAGRVFEDNFLIADVKMTADFPTERWFWFAPPFEGAGQSALLHKQPDDVWRIDFQLGWDIDRDAELDPARIRARVDAMLSAQTGKVPDYDLEWTSIYTFQCRRMEKFRQGRVLFAGDAAHQVSPFGARGANSGIQDTDNLAWRLQLVLAGTSDALLDAYAAEREFAADENILNSTRSTDFLTPKTEMSRIFRDAVLDLAADHAFARPMVNSGRLSVPCVYPDLPDGLKGPARTRPGAACVDAPVGDGFLLDGLRGFTLLTLGCDAPEVLTLAGVTVQRRDVPVNDMTRARYLGDAPAAVYLIRPDQHIAGRWPGFDAAAIEQALLTALQGGHDAA